MGLEKKLKKHLIDATAVSSVLNPAYALIETQVMGLPLDISINAKFIGTALNYLGLASAYSRGRDLFHKICRINDKHIKKKKVFDAIYGCGFALVVSPVAYFISGSRDIKEITVASSISALINTPMGAVSGYAIDVFRDFFQIKESKRLPELIKKQNNCTKKITACMVAAGSVAATAAYYAIIS